MELRITDMILMVLAVFGILLLMLNLNGLTGQGIDWSSVAGSVAPFIVLLIGFGIVVIVISRR